MAWVRQSGGRRPREGSTGPVRDAEGMGTPGIFCLEGDWSDSLTDRLSVRPGLDMFTTMRGARLIHRNAATRDEFAHYFGQWARSRYDRFPVAYLAYHGRRGRLELGRDEVTLAQLAELTPRPLAGRAIYFGACGTLAAPDEELRDFAARTGVWAIAGYTRTVDWAESAAFDFTLLPELLDSVDVKKLYARLCKRHPYFVDTLGLRLATADWASPRRRAAS